MDSQILIEEIARTFNRFGFKAEEPKVEMRGTSAFVTFKTEAATGQAAFSQETVTCSARIALNDDGTVRTWNRERMVDPMTIVTLEVNYNHYSGGHNGYSERFFAKIETHYGEQICNRLVRESDAAMFPS